MKKLHPASMKVAAQTFTVTALMAITLTSPPVVAAEKNQLTAQQHFQSLLKEKPGFYPVCNQIPVQVGKENFQKRHLTLSGLTGIHLDVEALVKSAGRKNVTMVDQLKQKIIQRLAKGGLKLLSKEEMERTPGQPQMSMFMSFPAHLTPAKKGEQPVKYRPDCCTMGIWTSFTQAGKILRDPDTNYKMGTWGEGHNTNDCSDPAGWMSGVILKTVDNFVVEKLKGDKDYALLLKKRKKQQPAAINSTDEQIKKLRKEIAQELAELQKQEKAPAPKPSPPPVPKPIKPVQPRAVTPQPPPVPQVAAAPQYCNNAVRTYIDMFATNQVHIDSDNYYVLDSLIADMRACPMYNYVIETHADPRSSFDYNEKLSALRAASIQGYLLAQGIAKNRFITQSFGELNPVTLGTTELDYAANRRVVVRPYLRRAAR